MHWTVEHSEYLFNEPWLTIRKEICALPNGKKHHAYYVLEYPEWVSAFALTTENKVVMVKQYRHGLGVESVELPGGVVDKDETPEQAVKRELLEETGYEFESLINIGKLSPNPATSNNYMHIYLARNGRKTTGQNLDETEEVEVQLRTIGEVKQLLKNNKIVQALHSAAIFYALEHLGEIKL